MRSPVLIVVLVLVLAAAGFAAFHVLGGSNGPAIPAPPTTATTIIQPNGQKIHIVTSLPKPKQLPSK